MESSRVFVKNLPPSISEAEFRKHFSTQGREVTDVKLIPHRRIGFVGYKSHEDAARAVKYFNRSFIRMSRIAVDFATPVSCHRRPLFPFPSWPYLIASPIKIVDSNPKLAAQNAPGRDAVKTKQLIKPRTSEGEPLEDDANSKKRKRDSDDESDPKLQEYLETMGHAPKKAKDLQGLGVMQPEIDTNTVPAALLEAGESDDEYEDIPPRPTRQPAQTAPAPELAPAQQQAAAIPAPVAAIELPVRHPREESAVEAPQVPADATDYDWLRSRTNRLLDLVDPNDPAFSGRPLVPVSAVVPASDPQQRTQDVVPPAGNAMDIDEAPAKVRTPEDVVEMIKKTSRLFLRNLSYTVTEDDVQAHFSKFGTLDEVSPDSFISGCIPHFGLP